MDHKCNYVLSDESFRSQSSGSSDFHGDNPPSPDVVRSRTQPRVWTENSAQTEPNGALGPFRGLGLPNRGIGACGRAPMAARGFGEGRCGGRAGRRGYQPRQCGLCSHHHVFDTRTGLNNHSTKQHGFYYSLKGDCFRPLVEADLRIRIPKIQDAQRHHWAYGTSPHSQGRARHMQGRTRLPYARFAQPVR